MKLSKFSRKIIAFVCSLALVITGIMYMPTTASADALQWAVLEDHSTQGGTATIANTSTETAYGVTYDGFTTDYTWGGDSVWQGKAQTSAITTVSGNNYKLSVDFATSAKKNIRVQILGNGALHEETYEVDTTRHLDVLFTANSASVSVVLGMGATYAEEAGVYDIEVSNLTVAETTETTTTEEVTTDVSGYSSVEGARNNVKINDWTLYAGGPLNWGGGYMSEKGTRVGMDLSVRIDTATSEYWGLQAKYHALESTLDASKTYTFVAKFDSNAATKLALKLDGYDTDDGIVYDITSGENTITRTISGTATVTPVFAFTQTTAGTIIDFTSITATAEGESTEAPTEAPTQAPTEAPTEAPTAQPGSWIDTNGGWLSRKADGTFEAGSGASYNTEGISGIYAGNWSATQDANIKVSQNSQDPYSVDINVLNSTQNDQYLTQVCFIKTGLDDTKAYEIKLKADDTVLHEVVVNGETSYQFCVGTGYALAAGEHTLTIEVEEQSEPEPPEVQTITITPNTAQITANHNIWASWTNPENTTKTYAYINSVATGNGPIAANGWDFNTQATQPMTGVDQVSRTKDNGITIEEGGTYTLIVESYNAWDQKTGYGEVEITIPGLTPEEQEIQEYMNKINTSDNLAYQKTPIVASNQNTAGNICDGNKDSRWQADKTIDNTYFAVDLGTTKKVNTVLVSWEASNAKEYEIYTADSSGTYGANPVAVVSGLDNNKAVIKLSKNLDVNARYVKVVATELSGNAEAYGISPYELAVFGGDLDEGYYDVNDYKGATATSDYPTQTDKVFAGWFEDDTCANAYMGTTGVAYAKFVDAKSLTVKFQDTGENPAANVRFVSTVDSVDYQSVGFKFTGTYGNSVITQKTKTTESLYTKIKGGGQEYVPSTAFDNDDSAYFFTYTVRGMSQSSTWTVTPFFVTLDGTTVEGTENTYPPASS